MQIPVYKYVLNIYDLYTHLLTTFLNEPEFIFFAHS